MSNRIRILVYLGLIVLVLGAVVVGANILYQYLDAVWSAAMQGGGI